MEGMEQTASEARKEIVDVSFAIQSVVLLRGRSIEDTVNQIQGTIDFLGLFRGDGQALRSYLLPESLVGVPQSPPPQRPCRFYK